MRDKQAVAKRTADEGLMSCIRTLLEIEHGSFPDGACLQCENLGKCEKLYAYVLGGSD